MTRWLPALCLCLVACDCAGDPPEAPPSPDPPPPTAISVPRLFPLSVGDRWRVDTSLGDNHFSYGVTGVDDDGVVAVFGTRHLAAERYRASDDAVELVSPEGDVLEVVLRAPLTEGSTWEYQVLEGEVRVECEARVLRTGVARTVAGNRLEGCVELSRACHLPAGKPFPVETRQLTDDVLCPGVGRVFKRVTLTPPPHVMGMPAERTETLVFYRVAGAPRAAIPEPWGCDGFLLLPSDVQAACGAVRAVAPPGGVAEGDRCTHRFVGDGGEITIVAERREQPELEETVDAWLRGDDPAAEIATHESGVRVRRGDAPRFALTRGPVTVRVAGDAATCSAAHAYRLVPLLGSLLD